MTIPQRYLLATLAAFAWMIAAAVAGAQADPWAIEVRASSGSLTVDAARPVIEGARSEIAECSDGPGPHRFEYTISLRPNGQVREAEYDRGATSDPRAARCIRHALLALRFPAHDTAATLVLTLRSGEFAGAPPSTAPTTAPPTTAPIAPPTTAPPTVGPTLTPAPIATPMPSDAPASGDVTIGAIGATPDRTAAQLLAVITPQRPALVACYATARGASPALSGEATLHLTITAEGRVSNAMFQGSEALASALAGCTGQAARTWVFSATSAETRVSIPLTFGGAARPVRR